MTTKLHLVFGGELKDTAKSTFKDAHKIDVVGLFPSYAKAYDAWKAASQKAVDQANVRYFIAHLHRLREEEIEKPSPPVPTS